MLIPISAYVQQADGNTVQVVVLDADARAALQALGVAGQAATLCAEVGDDIGKARLFAALRDRGVAFFGRSRMEPGRGVCLASRPRSARRSVSAHRLDRPTAVRCLHRPVMRPG